MKKSHSNSKWKGFLFALLWTVSFGLFAQNITVTGSVTDATGMSVIVQPLWWKTIPVSVLLPILMETTP